MFYYLYRITNLVNNKIYVGVHKTPNLNDGYMGSGKVILRTIKKHGTNNFKKEILEQFDCAEAMFAREKEVVTEEFLARDDVYNLRRGGNGGFDHINRNKESHKKFASKGGKITATRYDSPFKDLQWRQKFSAMNNPDIVRDLCRRANSPESIAKKRETWLKTGRGKGSKNSQSGTMWITNEKQNAKIKKTGAIPVGWRAGRVTGAGSYRI